MTLDPGTVLDGRYEVEALLGVGGMAEVFLARHVTLGSLHAVKLIDGLSPAVRRRLLAEGQIQAALRHPNVVAVTDAFETGGTPALVLEYVRGPSLAEVLVEFPLSDLAIDDLVTQLLAGVEAAHERGIVHRDLKPTNLLIDVGRMVPVLKVADFGLVKVLEGRPRSLTRPGTSLGTPEFMSPEQIRDSSQVDKRADIFSLGAILYELVTRERCFAWEDLLDLYNRIDAGSYVPVRELNPHAPQRVVNANAAALQPDRDRRCPDIPSLRRLWFAGAPPRPSRSPWHDGAWLRFAGRWNPALDPSFSGGHPIPDPSPSPAVPRPPLVRDDRPTLPIATPARPSSAVGWGVAVLAIAAAGAALTLPFVHPPVARPQSRPPTPAVAPKTPDPAPLAEIAAPSAPSALLSRPTRSPVPAPAPAPVPVPVPMPPPDLVLTSTPSPVPPPAPTFEITGADGMTLSLRDDAGHAVPLSDAGFGRYTLIAFFEPRVPTDVATLELSPGSRVTVRCSANARKCVANQN
jgi:serine/threonine-protein kinase